MENTKRLLFEEYLKKRAQKAAEDAEAETAKEASEAQEGT